jgi:hypothetical protein
LAAKRGASIVRTQNGKKRSEAMFTTQKIVWAILMIGLAGVLYLAFRGYLAPAFLLDFANTMLC